MLATSWMFQWSAVRSAWRAWPNPALLEPCCFTLPWRRGFSSRGLRCGQAEADIELPGGCFRFFPLVHRKAGGIRALGHPAFSLSLWLLTIPVLKSCQHTALCLPFAFCCSVHLELLAMLLELLRLASILQKKEIHPNTNKASFIRKLWCFCHFASPLNFSNPT